MRQQAYLLVVMISPISVSSLLQDDFALLSQKDIDSDLSLNGTELILLPFTENMVIVDNTSEDDNSNFLY